MPQNKTTTVLLKVGRDQVERWHDALKRHNPDIEVRIFPFLGDVTEIDFAVVWQPPLGLLASLPNVKAVMSIGAGVDHILKDPDYPRAVPLVRMVDTGLTAGMVEYITMATLMCSRQMYSVFLNQSGQVWDEIEAPLAKNVKVGFLGLGEIGLAAAEMLQRLGYKVMGWTRTEKNLSGITTYAGREGLERMLGWTDILVNVLPLTPDTQGILGAGTFNRMPKGSCLINVGRGQHCKEADLIKALDNDRLACAILDVFQEEPLPVNNPLWTHEKVIVTPHIGGLTKPESSIKAFVRMMEEVSLGLSLTNQVDLIRGY